MECSQNSQMKIVKGDAGYVLEDVPHLTDYIPDLPVTLFLCFCIFSIPIYYLYILFSSVLGYMADLSQSIAIQSCLLGG